MKFTGIILCMDEIESFSKKVISAVEQKTKSFDEVILPQILEKYRLLQKIGRAHV